jgi:NADH dehydrogenase
VVVGSGPTGVECSGAISELIRLLAGLPEVLSEATTETLWRKHVEVRFGSAVNDFDGKQIVLINWAWDYIFYDQAVRLIVRE